MGHGARPSGPDLARAQAVRHAFPMTAPSLRHPTLPRPAPAAPIVYPESDGLPMADNTKQFDAIVFLKTNLDDRLPDFVAGDLFWYPVEGHPEIVVAPDVLVCLGRPKGARGSYRQWEEDGIAPKVVFEVLSPNNTVPEMLRKAAFYATHGVDEFYVYDPDTIWGWGQIRGDDGQTFHVDNLDGWTSPLLGIRFDLSGDTLSVTDRQGKPFESTLALRDRAAAADARAEAEAQRAEAEAQRAEAEAQRAEAEAQRADAAAKRAEALAEKLRALGVDPG
jgi:Uma2 family endonuclease